MIKNLEHIGIAVQSKEEAIRLFSTLLGRKPYKSEIVASEGVETIFFGIGNIKIELLVSVSEESAVDRFLKTKGPGIHHIAFEVEDINASIQNSKENGFSPVSEIPKQGADNKQIVFLHPKTAGGVLIEFCQGKEA